MRDKSITCLVGLLIHPIFRWKNRTWTEVLMQFFHEKSNELGDQQDMFYYKSSLN